MSDIRCRIIGVGYLVLVNIQYQTPNTRHLIFDIEYLVLNIRCWIIGVKYLVLDLVIHISRVKDLTFHVRS